MKTRHILLSIFIAAQAQITLASTTVGIFRHKIPDLDEVMTSWKSERTTDSLPKHFKALVWNIHKESHPEMLETLDELLKTQDLFLAQEGFLLDPLNDFFSKQSEFSWTFTTSFLYQNRGTGVFTGSRASASSESFFRSNYTEPLIKCPKMALMSLYKIEGSEKQLAVINIHALNFTPNYKQYDQLKKIEETLSVHDGPILFAGDFNTWNQDRLDNLAQMAARLQMTEVLFPKDSLIKTMLGHPLDHAFVRGLKVISSRTISNLSVSDHIPLEIELEVEP